MQTGRGSGLASAPSLYFRFSREFENPGIHRNRVLPGLPFSSPSPRGALPAPGGEGLHRRGFPFKEGLDPAVRQVPDPSRHTPGTGCPDRPGPEGHALDDARYENADALHRSLPCLKIPFTVAGAGMNPAPVPAG